MRKLLSALWVMALSAGSLLLMSGPAQAKCHLSRIDASPNPVEEGLTNVTVTITRTIDTAAGGCKDTVDYTTSDGSAKEPDDYKKTSGTCDKFETDALATTCEFKIPIREDTIFEGNETFKASFGGQHIIAGEVTITIEDDDPSPPPAPASPKASPKASPSPSSSPSPTKSASPTPSASATPSPTPSAIAAAKKGKGPPAGLIIGIIALVVAGGAGVGLWYLRRAPAT